MRLYGKNSVIERIKNNPKTIKKIYLKENSDLQYIENLARQKGITCIQSDKKTIEKLAQKHKCQGVIAQVKDFLYADLDQILLDNSYTLIALSNITDPQNFGSIIRTISCMGNFVIIIPEHRSVHVTEAVLKVACGGENFVPIVKVNNLVYAIEKVKKAGWWVAGSVVEGGESILGFEMPNPLCLVIGAEGSGIRKGVIDKLDFKINLPMPGAKLSLNAAVACAIFCYEFMRQRALK